MKRTALNRRYTFNSKSANYVFCVGNLFFTSVYILGMADKVPLPVGRVASEAVAPKRTAGPGPARQRRQARHQWQFQQAWEACFG